MSKAIITEQHLHDIADAIIAKGGATAPMTPAQIPDAIQAIPSGGGGGGGYSLTVNMAYYLWSGTLELSLELADGSSSSLLMNVVSNVGILTTTFNGQVHNPVGGVVAVTLVRLSTYNDSYSQPPALNGVQMVKGRRYELSGDSVFSCNMTNTCLLRGTLITLADGSHKPIESIGYDDDLLVWNFDDGRLDHAKPCWIKVAEHTKEYVRDTFANGIELLTTGRSDGAIGHSVFNMERGMFVHDTESVGAMCRMEDGSWSKLIRSEIIEGSCEFYNLMTERHVNCFANGVLTSSRLNNILPVDTMTMRFVGKPRHAIENQSLSGIPSELIDGLRLREQPEELDEVVRYVKTMLSVMKERV